MRNGSHATENPPGTDRHCASFERSAIVVHSRHAMQAQRIGAALESRQGLEIVTIEQLVARLAGGFLRPINSNDLKVAIASAIEEPLGDLDPIKRLPGFKRAAATTLSRVWAAGLDLQEEEAGNPAAQRRIKALHSLEKGVLGRLPNNQLRPAALVEAAIRRIAHAPAIFGRIEIRGRTEMSPVWRPVLKELGRVTEVVWSAEARQVPSWLADPGVSIVQRPSRQPDHRMTTVYSCATARHEILEALRWARRLMVQGVRPEQIAIATPSPHGWDDHLLALSTFANLPVHFIHGRPALSSSEGQLTAALAETLLRGLSHRSVIRLIALLRIEEKKYRPIPGGWWQSSMSVASLTSPEQWFAFIDQINIPDSQNDYRPLLGQIIATVSRGLGQAEEIGINLLGSGAAGTLWKQAVIEGPPTALDVTLAGLRLRDALDPGVSIVWGPAAVIAAVPRDYCWLVGLTSRSWPRHASEDPLLPSHIIPAARLDPLPVHEADRRDFRTISDMTASELVLSRARRDSEGRLNGISPLYPENLETHLSLSRTPSHALNDSDRMMARPQDFSRTPRSRSALGAWKHWHREDLSAHDGLIRANHPLLVRALERTQSASSLVRLLRDPLGYLWFYGFGWHEPEELTEPLTINALTFGRLLHAILETAVTGLEQSCGLSQASDDAIKQAVSDAARTVSDNWTFDGSVPPQLIWKSKVAEAVDMATTALTRNEEPLTQQKSWAEIPFGGIGSPDDRAAAAGPEFPWDPLETVYIPDTGMRIGGIIDRMDISGDHRLARITDYKSGRGPRGQPQLANGAELQRCLYAFAATQLIGNQLQVDARLLYLGNKARPLSLKDPKQTLEKLTDYINRACDLFLCGKTLPGPEASAAWYDLAFALPGGATQGYLERKQPRIMDALESLVPLWSED